MTAEVVMSILLRRERGWLRSRETRIHIESAQRTVKVPKMSDSMKSAMSCAPPGQCRRRQSVRTAESSRSAGVSGGVLTSARGSGNSGSIAGRARRRVRERRAGRRGGGGDEGRRERPRTRAHGQ